MTEGASVRIGNQMHVVAPATSSDILHCQYTDAPCPHMCITPNRVELAHIASAYVESLGRRQWVGRPPSLLQRCLHWFCC